MPSFWCSFLLRRISQSCSTGCRTIATNSEINYYEVLEVPVIACQRTIKQAFRKKAKVLHPDAQSQLGRGDQEAFVRLLTAYQVLSNPRSRELYDVSISCNDSPHWQKAAAAGVHGRSKNDETDSDLPAGLQDLLRWEVDDRDNVLAKLRTELQRNVPPGLQNSTPVSAVLAHNLALRSGVCSHPRSDLHAALRCAYLGPVLDLEKYQLPDCFEADERSTPHAPEVLELVSGRQLLGVVQERRAKHVPGRPSDPYCSLERQEGDTTGRFYLADQQQHPDTTHQVESNSRGFQRPEQAQDACGQGLSRSASRKILSADQKTEDCSWGEVQSGATESPSASPSEVLDLVMDNDVVASAVRQRMSRAQHNAAQGAEATGRWGSQALEEPSTRRRDVDSREQCFGNEALRGRHRSKPNDGLSLDSAECIKFYRGSIYKGCLVSEGSTDDSFTAAKYLNAEGVHTHTVLCSSTPLVRHLSVVAEGSPASGRVKGSSATVFRARRAWLPPSSLWLFRPRSYEHDIGGWYIEWIGHQHNSHPAWMDPAVCVLATAFTTLDYEKAKQQPQGSFARVRTGAEPAAGAFGWLKSMLQFHGRFG